MKISYNWLANYISPIPGPEEVSALLTDCGLEVESLDRFESVKGGLNGFVTAKVVECEKHPNAERLSLTKLDVGSGELISVVCGAPNVRAGQKVIVALPGAVIYPPEGEPFTIKQSKIRGELSAGMICAEIEIGVGTGNDGILVLPENIEVGIPAAQYFGITTDSVFEIGLTPNRVDAASHYGVARDLFAVKYKDGSSKLCRPETRTTLLQGDLPIKVSVQTPEALTRYSAIVIDGIKVAPSPEWLQTRLRAIGLKPINNVVDITNFVLHETGQPLHAFDVASIGGNSVNVRTFPDGTPFTTLDGTERKLRSTDLIIADAGKPMCLAGIFGGLNSGVKETTQTVFLESACFNPVWIRKSSRHHNLKTDASFRFERGADPEICLYALQRAADLLAEVAGGRIVPGFYDYYPEPVRPREISYPWWKLNRLAGSTIPREEAIEILKRLDITVLSSKESGLKLQVPPFKVDVTNDADVTEEILRIYGYNRIPDPEQIRISVSNKKEFSRAAKLRSHLSDFLSARGFAEVLNNSLSAEAYLRFTDADSAVFLANPLSSELNILRQSLIPGICESIAWNSNRQQPDLAFYEWGKVYSRRNDGYDESERLCVAISGNPFDQGWIKEADTPVYFRLKGALEALLLQLKINPQNLSFTESEFAAFSTSVTLRYNSEVLGQMGQVHPELTGITGIEQDVWVAELNWQVLQNLYFGSKTSISDIPRFPVVTRDLALLLPVTVRYEDVVRVTRQTERKLLKDIRLFDVYTGEKLPAGHKSYAISFQLYDENQTLTDKQVEKTMSRLVNAFKEELGGVLR